MITLFAHISQETPGIIFKLRVQRKCGVQDEKYGVQNSILLQVVLINYFERYLIQQPTIFTHRP